MRSVIVALTLALPSSAVADPAVECPKTPELVVVDHGEPYRYRAKWLAAGGVVLWVASGVFGAVVEHKYETHEIERDLAKNGMQWATIMFAAGTLTLGAAAYYYFARGRAEPVQTVVPVVDRNGGGLALMRRF